MINNSNYPVINHIDDVLLHIKGYDEISVNSKNGYTCICYNIQTPELFDIIPGDEYGSLIRRECRGILFNSTTGEIISRPFEKFFNLEEKEETKLSNISLLDDHIIEEKVDGSMIRVFMLDENDKLRFGTKRGETDISKAAELYAHNTYDNNFFYWLFNIVNNGMTPIFEWVSKDSRVVIDYDIDQLVLLAVRDNKTGQYVDNLIDLEVPGSISIVDKMSFGNQSLPDIINYVKNFVGQEGVVLYFPDNGKRIKIKSDWYINIHRIKEQIVQDRHLILTVLNNQLDDVLSILPEYDRNRINQKVDSFWKNVQLKSKWLEQQLEYVIGYYYDTSTGYIDKKKLSLEYMPKVDKQTQVAIYTLLNSNKSPFDYILEQVRKQAERSEKNYKLLYNDWICCNEEMNNE